MNVCGDGGASIDCKFMSLAKRVRMARGSQSCEVCPEMASEMAKMVRACRDLRFGDSRA